ncbi:hypothetical protein ACJZ2D_004805 [Fusarium nematophilum]
MKVPDEIIRRHQAFVYWDPVQVRIGSQIIYLQYANGPGDQEAYNPDNYVVDTDKRCYLAWLDDPLHIPNLTVSIISNLQLAKQPTSHGLANHFENLPTEIRNEIVPLLTTQPVTLDCNYSIPQVYWKHALPRLPFLWDIDEQIINEESQTAELEGIEWDWEKLVRQLMTPVTTVDEKSPCIQDRDEEDEYDDEYEVNNPIPWSYAQVGLAVPPGLNNRRRIWQILEEMYPNDVGMSQPLDEDCESVGHFGDEPKTVRHHSFCFNLPRLARQRSATNRLPLVPPYDQLDLR